MPIRQDVQGDISAQAPQGYQSPGAAQARYQPLNIQDDGSRGFWDNLIQRGIHAGRVMDEKASAEAYLEGQQDSALGKARNEVHTSMQEDYTQGYNRAQVGSQLAQFQLTLPQKAVEYVNAGKSVDDFHAYVKGETDTLLNSAGEQGMKLKDRDWQSWLAGVSQTRDTAADLYQTKSLQRAEYMKGQALAAEGNAAVAGFQAADEAGNPMGALGGLSAHVERIYSDNTLSPQQKDGALADFSTNVLASARTSSAVDGVSSYITSLPQFKSLPTEVQTGVLARSQAAYQQRAQDEAGQVFAYTSTVQSVNDINTLNSQYPLSTYISTLNEAQKQHKISPGQMYSMVEQENTRRIKLQKGAMQVQALSSAPTLSDIATQSGLTMGKAKTALESMYATQHGGYSGGGLALLQRGLSTGASDLASVGIGMMQQDAASLGTIDSKALKVDSDGNRIYPSTVVSSVTNLKAAYDAAQKAGNSVGAAQLLSGLPPAVAYGITQGVDQNSMLDVVYRRADDIAAGRVTAQPAQMDKALMGTTDDVRAGLFDTGMTSAGQKKNLLGVQSWLFQSAADTKLLDTRMSQVNSAMGEEYTAAQQSGKLPMLDNDGMKKYLIGKVAERAVRVDDGTDAGSLLILPKVANKEALLGSVDNGIIAAGLKEPIKSFKERNPGAVTVSMRYDNMSNELVLTGSDKDNVNMTVDEGIPISSVRDSVMSVETRLTNKGQGNTTGALSVPGAGFVKFNSGNSYGIAPNVYSGAVNQLISYEGYSDSKGFSVLGVHPTTGAKLNDEKYVKQPGDTPQVAADKLSMYLSDQVMPKVMQQMPKFDGMPEYLKQRVFSQLVDTTYHAGNADAFGHILTKILSGDTRTAYDEFRASPLFKDAGGTDSRRNKDRFQTMDAVSQFAMHQRQ